MVEEKGQDPEETPEEEEPEGGEPAEPEEEPVTAEDAMALAQALQKGYTLTRQDMAAIRENQERIQEALEEIRKDKRDEFSGGEEEPLTVKKLLDLQSQQRKIKEAEDVKLNQRIDRQLDELRFQGVIKTEKDEKELLDFAVKRKITNLSDAADRWKELEDAKKEGIKEGLKGKVKAEAGSKVGTSQKTGTKEQGIDYDEIASKEMEDFARE